MNNMEKIHFIFAKKLATILDDQFEFLGIKFGLDPILDLIPGLGDVLAVGIGLYIVWVGYKMKLPPRLVRRMIFNAVLDFLIGLVPIAGNIGTIFFRSNRMNVKIIEDYRRNDGGVVEEGVIVG